VYTYGAKLEVASPRFPQRADFFVYIYFACLVILVSCVHIAIIILLFSDGIEVHLCGIILELRNRL
jgi:Derlin-2/3